MQPAACRGVRSIAPYSIEEVTEAVASLHPGIELAECRFVHDAAFPRLTAILALWFDRRGD